MSDVTMSDVTATSDSTTSPSSDAIDRRRFLQRIDVLTGAVACVMLPLVASACAARTRYITPRLTSRGLEVPIADIPASGLLVEDGRSDLPIYLRRTTADAYTAVSTRCTHRGCQVDPTPDKLVCPCHGSEYTFGGAVLQGPAQQPLMQFTVSVTDTTVVIQSSTGSTS